MTSAFRIDLQFVLGKNPNDPQNKHTDNPEKQGVNDSKEGRQRQGIGTPHHKEDK